MHNKGIYSPDRAYALSGDFFMQESQNKIKHTLFMENRQSLELGGIKDVGAFNEEEIAASSDWGEIIVKGSALHVETLDLETGVLKIKGRVTALIYNDVAKTKSFFGRMFS